MSREEFIEILEDKGYSYEMEGDKIIITHGGMVSLLYSIPVPLDSKVEFRNDEHVDLNNATELPENIVFNNTNDVFLGSLKNLPKGIKFQNTNDVFLGMNLEDLPSWLEFDNGNYVWLGNVNTYKWGCKISGIKGPKIINLLIKNKNRY
jgi:hypothetical protein